MCSGYGWFKARVQRDGCGGGWLHVGARHSAGVSGGGGSLIAVNSSLLVGACIGAAVCW